MIPQDPFETTDRSADSEDSRQRPSGWSWRELGSFGDIVGGGTPSRSIPGYWSGRIPWASVKDFSKDSTVLDDTEEHITEEAVRGSAATLVPPGTPVVCTRMAVGRCALTSQPTAINQDLKAFLLNGDIDAGFFVRLLHLCGHQLDRVSVGSTVRGISLHDLRSLAVPFPESLEEQVRIAKILGLVDALIRQSEEGLRKLNMLRTGLINDLLTCGIDENGELRDPLARPNEFLSTPLGTIPRSWNVTRIGQVLLGPPRNGYSPPESQRWTGRFMLGLGCLSLEGFRPNQLKLAPNDAALEPFLLNDGDLLVSRSNTQDLVALPGLYRDIGAPCFYPDLMMRLRPNSSLYAEFLELLLRHSRSRRFLVASANGTSGSMVKITGAGLMAVPVAFPSVNECDEQQRILQVKAALDEEVNGVRQGRDKLVQLKEGLAQDLLTGSVRVPGCALEDSR